ncbi:MAG: HAD-IB family phosphatase [Ignavibacteriales bacterium]|nr:HAD-IB family phosphatase [Ignavibacteriales bacterium]
MISVIIPVLNEERTIGKVINKIKDSPIVDEIIIVDDKSIDGTIQEAKNSGASILISTKIGKGASMRDGLLVAKNDIIVYLDGDVENYSHNSLELLVSPLLKNEADFVKSSFEREAGRVTELVAKPLLSLLFPALTRFSQPLSGMIAARREYLKQVKFEDDYGVDIGILIDMELLGARMVEVNIGKIVHKMKQWQELGRMSREVAKAILKRATNKSLVNLDTLETINVIRDQMEFAIKETLKTLKKMVVFDLDNTILTGRFIEKASTSFGFQKELIEIISKNQESYLLTKFIAKLFKGINIAQIVQLVDGMNIISDAKETIAELKKRGYIVGIISDSYDCVANHVKNKIGADFALANELEFSTSVSTGEIKIPLFFLRTDKSKCNHNSCKSNALMHIAEQYKIELSNIIAVGDSENDVCMVKMAGIGVSFCSTNNLLNHIADRKIETKTFLPILDFAT